MRKTVQIGKNPEIRICSKLENSISPSIVAKDKKGYQVTTPWDIRKYDYIQAKKYSQKLERDQIKTNELKLTTA